MRRCTSRCIFFFYFSFRFYFIFLQIVFSTEEELKFLHMGYLVKLTFCGSFRISHNVALSFERHKYVIIEIQK